MPSSQNMRPVCMPWPGIRIQTSVQNIWMNCPGASQEHFVHRRTDWEKSSEKWNWPDLRKEAYLAKKSEEAARLLAFTDKSLISISDYLGFSSQSHFARVFKKYIGMTPSEYRSR